MADIRRPYVPLPPPPIEYDPRDQAEFRRLVTDALGKSSQDTIALMARARITATSTTTVTVRVAVADPYPQGTNTASIAHTYTIASGAGTVDKTSPQTCTPQSTLTEAAGTYVDYVVTRPASATGPGRITFTVTAPNRLSASDAVDVPNVDPTALVYTQCLAAVTAVSATQITVTVTANATNGTPTVGYVTVTGSASLASGHGAGVYSYAQNGTDNVWVFNRGAFGSGVGQAQFRAVFAGAVTDDDFVDIPEVGRDTTYLSTRARVISSNATTVVVRYAVADPYPQGANSATITYQNLGSGGVSPASGGTVTPASTITEAAGTYIDYTITRPAFASGTGRVTFTASAAGRVSDSDSTDVPAQEKTSFGPSLDVKVTPGSTSYTLVATYTGTMTYKIDGGVDNSGTGSPQTITVTRNPYTGATITYVFKCVLDGQTITTSASIPACEPSTALTVGNCVSSNGGAAPPPYNQLDITFSYSGLPTGTVFDVSYNNGVSGGMDSSTGIAMSGSPQTVTFTSVTFAGTPGKGSVFVQAKLNGVVIASSVKNKTYLT